MAVKSGPSSFAYLTELEPCDLPGYVEFLAVNPQLAIFENQTKSAQLLRVVSLAGKGSLLQRTVWQRGVAPIAGEAALSPDGRWLAYSMRESGVGELYVTALDNAADPARLAAPGTHPVWAGDGRQLFYTTDRGIVAVTVEGAAANWAARERVVIPTATLQDRRYNGDDFDVSRDGARVLLVKAARPDHPVTLKGLRSCGGAVATLLAR